MTSTRSAQVTRLLVTLHTAGLRLGHRIPMPNRQRDERGASTLEIVFWAVALLALAGIVYAAISSYINGKLPGIS